DREACRALAPEATKRSPSSATHLPAYRFRALDSHCISPAKSSGDPVNLLDDTLAHRAKPALRAMARRCAAERDFVRRLPPKRPISRITSRFSLLVTFLF